LGPGWAASANAGARRLLELAPSTDPLSKRVRHVFHITKDARQAEARITGMLPVTGVIRVVSANLQEGGLDADGSRARWQRSVDAIGEWSPDVVCVQEMAARRDPRLLRTHLWATANALGMVPILGSEGGISGNHPAILVNPRKLTIIDEGPPPRQPGHDPAWCEAVVWLAPSGPAVRVHSVHLPPGSAAEQLAHAQRLANRVAQRGELAILAGDWNCYAPADQVTADTLASQPLHLRPARMHARLGQLLAANYDVHEALAAVGMTDAAAGLDPDRRDPPGLTPTGDNGGGRVDRFYLSRELWGSGAVQSYTQKDGGGSDHLLIMITLGQNELACAEPPGFRP
jgi:endonuclease/exonuclease/phosphatase family metal-dependent hydrolase